MLHRILISGFRNTLRGVFALALLGNSLAQAQDAAAVPTRPLWVEIGITVLMIGVVLFAVCRTSNRT